MSKAKKLLFEKKIPVFWLLLILLGVFVISTSFIFNQGIHSGAAVQPASNSQSVADCVTMMDQIREGHSNFVRPLLLTDVMIQDRSMVSLKADIQSLISQKISANQLQVASVYIRKLNNGAHISINENELFNPASLMKVAYLFCYLEEEDHSPGRLQKRVYFDKHFEGGNNQNIVDFKLKEQTYYTIAELLHAMIVYSDNDASMLLMQNHNNAIFQKLFSDLQLPPPPRQGEYFIGTSDFSKFFRVLYSSTYLSREASEYAINLLLKSTFKDGVCAQLDPSIPVAHKFGERVVNNVAQLHESAIVYYNNTPYLITIMSKGGNLTPLKETMAEISEMALRYMQANP